MRAHDDVLAAALQSRVPFCLLGQPGSGRSTTIETLAQKLGIACVGLALDEHSSVADLDSAGAARRILAATSDEILLIEVGGRLDAELSGWLLRLVEKRRIDDVLIADKVRIVLTAGAVGDRSGDHGLSKELAKRFLLLDFVRMETNEWNRWVSLSADVVAAGFDLNPTLTDGGVEDARFEVAKFLGGKRDWPFAWKSVAEIMPFLPDPEARQLALEGLVGERSTEKFVAMLTNEKRPASPLALFGK